MRTLVATPDPARSRVVSFRLTTEEYEHLKRMAAQSGMTPGALARQRALLPTRRRHAVPDAPFAKPITSTTTGPITIHWKAA